MNLNTYNGIIRFYDGSIVAIELQEYSADGKYNWESTFNPNSHISTLDGVTLLDGHKYKRVKHTGETSWQLPYRIVPEEPIFRVQNGMLQYKLETQPDTAYVNLFDITTLQGKDGNEGKQGVRGEGWHIDQVGYYLTRQDCCNTSLNKACVGAMPALCLCASIVRIMVSVSSMLYFANCHGDVVLVH
jgi:hypothetical protein